MKLDSSFPKINDWLDPKSFIEDKIAVAVKKGLCLDQGGGYFFEYVGEKKIIVSFLQHTTLFF